MKPMLSLLAVLAVRDAVGVREAVSGHDARRRLLPPPPARSRLDLTMDAMRAALNRRRDRRRASEFRGRWRSPARCSSTKTGSRTCWRRSPARSSICAAKVGDVVHKGQALCAISSRDATAAVGEHIESHKDLELAEKTAAMTQDLFDHQAASRIALQQAQSDLAKARARVARNEQALRLLGLQSEADIDRFDGRVPVVSPIAGVDHRAPRHRRPVRPGRQHAASSPSPTRRPCGSWATSSSAISTS